MNAVQEYPQTPVSNEIVEKIAEEALQLINGLAPSSSSDASPSLLFPFPELIPLDDRPGGGW